MGIGRADASAKQNTILHNNTIDTDNGDITADFPFRCGLNLLTQLLLANRLLT